jgi:hypothetical protein
MHHNYMLQAACACGPPRRASSGARARAHSTHPDHATDRAAELVVVLWIEELRMRMPMPQQ